MKTQARYSWSKHFGIPAQTFGEFYYGLKKRTPEELVKAARSARSPVHKLFEWDDRRAAVEHRLLQARVMVNSLQVEIITPKGKQEQVTAFIRSSDRGCHVATLEASDQELTEAMQECWRDMLAFRARYKNLQVASSIISAINEVDRNMRRRVKKAA